MMKAASPAYRRWNVSQTTVLYTAVLVSLLTLLVMVTTIKSRPVVEAPQACPFWIPQMPIQGSFDL